MADALTRLTVGPIQISEFAHHVNAHSVGDEQRASSKPAQPKERLSAVLQQTEQNGSRQGSSKRNLAAHSAITAAKEMLSNRTGQAAQVEIEQSRSQANRITRRCVTAPERKRPQRKTSQDSNIDDKLYATNRHPDAKDSVPDSLPGDKVYGKVPLNTQDAEQPDSRQSEGIAARKGRRSSETWNPEAAAARFGFADLGTMSRRRSNVANDVPPSMLSARRHSKDRSMNTPRSSTGNSTAGIQVMILEPGSSPPSNGDAKPSVKVGIGDGQDLKVSTEGEEAEHKQGCSDRPVSPTQTSSFGGREVIDPSKDQYSSLKGDAPINTPSRSRRHSADDIQADSRTSSKGSVSNNTPRRSRRHSADGKQAPRPMIVELETPPKLNADASSLKSAYVGDAQEPKASDLGKKPEQEQSSGDIAIRPLSKSNTTKQEQGIGDTSLRSPRKESNKCSNDLESLNGNFSCPEGHPLEKFFVGVYTTGKTCHSCSKCSRQKIFAPESIYRCTHCDYDLCSECSGQGPTVEQHPEDVM